MRWQPVNDDRTHDCGASGCRVLRVLLERVVAGDGLRALERDYGLCKGTLDPIARIRRKARERRRP